MKKFAFVVGVVLFFNLVVSTVWYNWFDLEMNVIEDRFKHDYYGDTKMTVSYDDPQGLTYRHSGGIFKERNDHLSSEHIVHSCTWTSHEETGGGVYLNTMCLYFLLPFA